MKVEALRWESDGPALVLLHGAGGNAFVWEPLQRELSAFDVAAPSLPGRGATGGEAYEDARDAALWVGEWLEEIGASEPIVVGHSYGGSVAIELALSGASLGGLVLVATGARLRIHPLYRERGWLLERLCARLVVAFKRSVGDGWVVWGKGG